MQFTHAVVETEGALDSISQLLVEKNMCLHSGMLILRLN